MGVCENNLSNRIYEPNRATLEPRSCPSNRSNKTTLHKVEDGLEVSEKQEHHLRSLLQFFYLKEDLRIKTRDFNSLLSEAYASALDQNVNKEREGPGFRIYQNHIHFLDSKPLNPEDTDVRKFLHNQRIKLVRSIKALRDYGKPEIKFRFFEGCIREIETLGIYMSPVQATYNGIDGKSINLKFQRISNSTQTVAEVQTLLEARLEFVNRCIKDARANIASYNSSISKWIQTAKQISRASREFRHSQSDSDKYFANLVSLIHLPSVYAISQGIFDYDKKKEPSIEFMKEILNGLLSIPKEDINDLAAKGFKIKLGRLIKEIHPGERTFGEEYNDDPNVPGAYVETRGSECGAYFSEREVFMAEDDIAHQRSRDIKIADIIRHEVAHAVDSMKTGVNISSTTEFREAYMKDFQQLTDEQKIRFRYFIRLNTSTMLPREEGFSEAFAELLADSWGGGCMAGELTEYFPNTALYMTSERR